MQSAIQQEVNVDLASLSFVQILPPTDNREKEMRCDNDKKGQNDNGHLPVVSSPQ
jgi:hypothetical protein